MIDGVRTKSLRVIPDERGRLMEIFRADDEIFERFGQVYMTTTYPGVVKAWHYHKIQTDNIAVVRGMLKVTLYDPREDSPTKGQVNEFFIGEHNPMLIQIPPGIYHGWKCVGEEEAIVINCPTEPYNRKDPDEYRLPYDTDRIPYDWGIKMG
ncbi:MAG TPA: dTDP-4-dehydrorhamnose 3,5-epimerase [Candidatus Latescibacteria bacterium]|nr:dTDP-4-dehydrorhamnose 3,5-epimerase [Candidatus Latescibacterota bacterium]